MNEGEEIEKMNEIKGIGKWKEEVYMIFEEGNKDVFKEGDVEMKKEVGNEFDKEKRKDEEDIRKLEEKWEKWRGVEESLLWEYYEEIKGREEEKIM